MRKELDRWSLHVDIEDNEDALCRFLVGMDELRARLAPAKYPNIEITDEGYLWFNIHTNKGPVEILAFPFGFKEYKRPSIAVSLPMKVPKIESDLIRKLHDTARSIDGAKTVAAFCPRQETLTAYAQNRKPPLYLIRRFRKDPSKLEREDLLSYFGIIFPVEEQIVHDAEQTIRQILVSLNQE